MNEGTEKRPLRDWRAALLRITAFPTPEAPLEKRQFWDELGLGEPTSHEKTKSQRTDQGPALENWLVVTAGLGRIDWIYVPEPMEEAEPGFRDVGPFPEAMERFAGLLRGWLGERCPYLLRFAFGATVLLPVPDRIQGYREISAYLPFTVDGETASDFLYQINRPRTSSVVTDLRVNRLTRWSVGLRATVAGQLTANAAGVSSPAWYPLGSAHACQVVLDVNSVAEYKDILEGQVAVGLLGEFLQLAAEIVAEGDKP